MKNFVKSLLKHGVKNEVFWSLVNSTLIPMAKTAEWERELIVKRRIISPEQVRAISPDLRVKHGPFQGMQYPESTNLSPGFCPFLLGTYEQEIHHLICNRICSKKYSAVVDIGCASGYYAVGLAMRLKDSCVFAYDINEHALHACREMADINGVSERMTTGAFCDESTLRSLPLMGKALVICDTDGYEKELFTKTLVDFLGPHDVLIETHDYIDLKISARMKEVFHTTHKITTVLSSDDIEKSHEYDYEELRGYDLNERKIIVEEMRPAIQKWLFMEPHQ